MEVTQGFRRASKARFIEEFTLEIFNQQSIFFSQFTDCSSTIRIKRGMKLPVVGREIPAEKSCSKTGQAKDNSPVQGWEPAQHS